MLDTKIRKTYIIIAFFVLEAIAVYYWDTGFEKKLSDFYGQKLKEHSIAYSVAQNTFRQVTHAYFDQAINTADVHDVLQQLDSLDNTTQKDDLRDALYTKLEKRFGSFKLAGIKQLSFYLPNNEVFLHCHNPEKYGDPVGSKRFSVRKANKYRRPISGFEESQYFNGFRYLFPIFNKQKVYLGCVEMGVGINTIRDEMAKVNNFNYAFIIHKKKVGAYIYQSPESNYIQSDVHARYLYQGAVYSQAQKIYKDGVNIEIRNELNKILKIITYDQVNSKRSFAVAIPHKGRFYTAAFLSIRNVAGDRIGYLISYSRNSQYKLLESNFYLGISATTLAILLILGFIYFENRTIRRIRRTNKEMKEQTKELRKLNNTKEKFLSFVAEDLTNPFQFLKGYSLALKEDFEHMPKDKIEHYLTLLYQASDNGNHLIRNLLDWSKLQRNDNDYEANYFYISRVIDGIIADFNHIAEAKKISLYSTVTEKTTFRVYAERSTVLTLVRNLISNALKFTQEGGVITVTARNLEKRLEITVEDNGKGMKQEVVSHLFSTVNAANDSEETAKLGLILSKEIIDRNKGSLRVESQEGKGSKFIFSLPTEPPYKLFKQSFRGSEVS